MAVSYAIVELTAVSRLGRRRAAVFAERSIGRNQTAAPGAARRTDGAAPRFHYDRDDQHAEHNDDPEQDESNHPESRRCSNRGAECNSGNHYRYCDGTHASLRDNQSSTSSTTPGSRLS